MKRTSKYTVAVKRSFTAHHFLVGGDWGNENEKHAHNYTVEVQLHGPQLDAHGYLVDIIAIENHLESVIAQYRNKTLNELPEFMHLNPSIEHFARIMCDAFAERVRAQTLEAISVTVWENDIAWARCYTEL